MMRIPPMRPARWTENEFIAVVEDDEGVGRMCGGYKNDTHGCRRLGCGLVRLRLDWMISTVEVYGVQYQFYSFREEWGGLWHE